MSLKIEILLVRVEEINVKDQTISFSVKIIDEDGQFVEVIPSDNFTVTVGDTLEFRFRDKPHNPEPTKPDLKLVISNKDKP